MNRRTVPLSTAPIWLVAFVSLSFASPTSSSEQYLKYPKSRQMGALTLYKKLHRLEAEAHTLAERVCNDPNFTDIALSLKEHSITRRVNALLGAGPRFFINLDPRGYALNVEPADAVGFGFKHDWGGYGIICPDC